MSWRLYGLRPYFGCYSPIESAARRLPSRQTAIKCGVDSSHLQPEQIAQLRRVVGRDLRFLNNLCARMQSLRFPVDDPLCRAALTARDAMQDLYTASHYAGCQGGVGKPTDRTGSIT